MNVMSNLDARCEQKKTAAIAENLRMTIKN
jgi:hypothetical protein